MEWNLLIILLLLFDLHFGILIHYIIDNSLCNLRILLDHLLLLRLMHLFQEMHRKITFFIETYQALIWFFRDRFYTSNTFQTRRLFKGRILQFAVNLDLCFTRLKHYRVPTKHLSGQKLWILELDQRSKRTVVILNIIVLSNLPDVGMYSWDTNVIANPHVAGSIPTNLEGLLVFCVQYEKHLLLRQLLSMVTRWKCFQNDEVILRAFYLNDVYNMVIHIYRKGKLLLAQLTIYLFVFYHNVRFYSF